MIVAIVGKEQNGMSWGANPFCTCTHYATYENMQKKCNLCSICPRNHVGDGIGNGNRCRHVDDNSSWAVSLIYVVLLENWKQCKSLWRQQLSCVFDWRCSACTRCNYLLVEREMQSERRCLYTNYVQYAKYANYTQCANCTYCRHDTNRPPAWPPGL